MNETTEDLCPACGAISPDYCELLRCEWHVDILSRKRGAAHETPVEITRHGATAEGERLASRLRSFQRDAKPFIGDRMDDCLTALICELEHFANG